MFSHHLGSLLGAIDTLRMPNDGHNHWTTPTSVGDFSNERLKLTYVISPEYLA